MYREVELAHGGKTLFRIGQGNRKIAAKADQHLGLSVDNRLHGCDRVMAMRFRRFETEGLLDPRQHLGAGLFGDSNGAVALHIGMAAQRADAGAGLAEIPAHQQKVCELLNVRSTLAMLRDAHAVGDDRRI